MAMTALEMVAFFEEQAADAGYGISAARKKQNPDLAVMNVNEQFKCNLMRGLIQWRHQVQSPRMALQAAVEDFGSGVEVVVAMGGGDAVTGLCFERAAIVSYLVDTAIESPPRREMAETRRLDYLIARWLQGDKIGQDYELCRRSLQKEPLAFATYGSYYDLMSGNGVGGEAVEMSCQLFNQRKRDSYFSGGDQTEGGGMDNAFTVDYRLAAICKKLAIPCDSVHYWRW